MIPLNQKAFAKINIGLEILCKRIDGYHEINSIFSTVSLADELLFSDSTRFEIECFPPLGIPDEQNLIYKTAKLMQDFFRIESLPVKITLSKNIPVGAGLGGGSSDAASVLLGLNNYFQLNASESELLKLASVLGSDVPYFLKNKTALVGGRGEKLEYFAFTLPYHVLLVMPDVFISTTWAYSNLNIGDKIKHPTNLRQVLAESLSNPDILKEQIFNDFEPHVFSHYNELAEIKKILYQNGAVYASMSGSGSALYGFFNSAGQAHSVKKVLGKYRTHICVPEIY
ncbi:MAG: 4-(cytidine 5'-diphospho)-2-C-methyl-D-erythritol kinase [Bacteroidota bacterium]|jgi:4-diphosphocytidyl-2-C-methyl-D-erythritol kinase